MIRRAVATAIGVMGDQFVLGRTIEAALTRAARDGFVCSFDMLGEGARTEADAERYEAAYARRHRRRRRGGRRPRARRTGHGISVKLSALSPALRGDAGSARLRASSIRACMRLAAAAAEHDINLTLDAEEADRLVAVAEAAGAAGARAGAAATGAASAWRCRPTRSAAPAGDRRASPSWRGASGRRLMVRLVKGAYWDAEIKRAQVGGRPDYPVYTTKPATDLSLPGLRRRA